MAVPRVPDDDTIPTQEQTRVFSAWIRERCPQWQSGLRVTARRLNVAIDWYNALPEAERARLSPWTQAPTPHGAYVNRAPGRPHGASFPGVDVPLVAALMRDLLTYHPGGGYV